MRAASRAPVSYELCRYLVAHVDQQMHMVGHHRETLDRLNRGDEGQHLLHGVILFQRGFFNT